MLLKHYLQAENITLDRFCREVDCNMYYMSRIMNGHTKPGKRLAREIERQTHGQVKVLEMSKRDIITAEIEVLKTKLDAKMKRLQEI
jgi:hypothetical protein